MSTPSAQAVPSLACPVSPGLTKAPCRLNTGEVKAFFEPNGPPALTFFFQARLCSRFGISAAAERQLMPCSGSCCLFASSCLLACLLAAIEHQLMHLRLQDPEAGTIKAAGSTPQLYLSSVQASPSLWCRSSHLLSKRRALDSGSWCPRCPRCWCTAADMLCTPLAEGAAGQQAGLLRAHKRQGRGGEGPRGRHGGRGDQPRLPAELPHAADGAVHAPTLRTGGPGQGHQCADGRAAAGKVLHNCLCQHISKQAVAAGV